MPEGPEVATVVAILNESIKNKIIQNVKVNYEKILANINAKDFIRQLSGQKIIEIKRRGKLIIFVLSEGYIVSHLRMEGKYKYNVEIIDKHTHVIFDFTDGSNLLYHDVRKFGKMFYYDKTINIYEKQPLNKLGMNPFLEENGKNLYQKCNKSNKAIKQILTDQSIITDIGNIYADEICFACKISPHKIAKTLSEKECDEIIKQTKIILNKAIKLGGSTIKSYQSSHGIDGRFQNELNVYGRQNQECPRCHNQITKDKLNGRGTHYCPYCQKS